MPADGFAAPIRLKDSALHRDSLAHDRFTWLRANAPVAWEDEPDGRGFWSVTRHADILAVSTDPATFSSARANGGHRIFEENDVAAETVETSMISMDPPEHLEYRRMLMPGFTPVRLRAMEAGIRARGAALIDRMLTKAADNDGIVDFVEDFAAPYAIQTLAELFGVSMDDGDKLFQWSNAIVAEEDSELRPSEEFTSRMVKEMVLYSFGLRAQREAAPGDDLISMLATARIDGEPISPGKFLATFILMVVAGNETTRNSLTGSVLAFADFPGALAQVKSDRALLRPCAQEIVRWVSPVHHMRRTATRDAVVGGQPVKAGDKVLMWYASGNRDEAVWGDPFAFRPDRFLDPAAPKHLGFGTGQHVCLGQRLAELQIAVAWELLLERVPTITPLDRGRRVLSNFINGWKELRVKIA